MDGREGLDVTQKDRLPQNLTEEIGMRLYGRGKTGLLYNGGVQPYYTPPSPPPQVPQAPSAPLGTAEWVTQEFNKKKERYAEALKNQRLIIEKGKEFNMPMDKVEAALKSKNLLKIKEPELSEPMLKILEVERKEKKKAGEPEALGFGDKELIKKTLIEMPKLKREAVVAKNISTQIDTARDLIAKGVTGKGGQLKSFLAPYMEMAGVDAENMSDSQKFQLLARAIIGPMRLEIVGPGPVSEWEQKLMQQISGGGGAAKEAASELLGHWQKLAQSKIDNYNDTLSGFSEVYPNVQQVYKPLLSGKEKETAGIPEGATPIGKTSGGKPVYQLPDGRYWVQ